MIAAKFDWGYNPKLPLLLFQKKPYAWMPENINQFEFYFIFCKKSFSAFLKVIKSFFCEL